MSTNKFYEYSVFNSNEKPYGFKYVIGNFIFAVIIILMLFFIGFSVVYIGVPVVGESMQNTLNEKGGNFSDVVYINRFAKFFVNDIIVIKEKDATHEHIIKRVIALEGDRVNFVIKAGTEEVDLVVNGNILTEDYVYDFSQNGVRHGEGMFKAYQNFTEFKSNYYNTDLFNEAGELVVPKGQVFVLGDNRGNSLDSSSKGPFELSQVVGKVDHIVKYGQSAFKYFFSYFTP